MGNRVSFRLGKWIHDLEVPGKGKIMHYGLYTCRGVQQCDSSEYEKRCEAFQAAGGMKTDPKNHPCIGSHGYEKEDAEWLVGAGADYLKEDSCGGNQTHSVAFSDYAKMRDAVNKSATAAGKKVFFSLCGWEDWYGPPDPAATSTELPHGFGGGPSLGNSYRIHGDGSSWSHLSGCTNTIAVRFCNRLWISRPAAQQAPADLTRASCACAGGRDVEQAGWLG